MHLCTMDEGAIERQCMALLLLVFPDVDEHGISLRPCSGGITNRLFRAELPSGSKVLVRVYGRKSGILVDRATELQTVRLLGEMGLAGKVHGTFTNGFVYDYVDGRALEPSDLPEHSRTIAQELATWHGSIGLAPSTKPVLFDKLRTWLAVCKTELYDGTLPIDGWSCESVTKLIDKMERRAQGFRMGFCHNDLLAPNIILKPDTHTVAFIDHEYAGPNPVAFDIANHFCEWAGFDCDYSRFPSHQSQANFISAYLDKLGDDALSVKVLLEQVKVLVPAAHLFWGLWALIQARNSDISFDYSGYGQMRFTQIDQDL